jgi:hypothetical protein
MYAAVFGREEIATMLLATGARPQKGVAVFLDCHRRTSSIEIPNRNQRGMGRNERE